MQIIQSSQSLQSSQIQKQIKKSEIQQNNQTTQQEKEENITAFQQQFQGICYYRKSSPTSKKKIKLNTSHSRGQLKLLKLLCKKNNWLQVFKQGNILWSGLAIPQQQLYLATQLFVNRIPAMPHICHKKTMGFILNKFREYWPGEYEFYPKTYLLPQDYNKLQQQLKKDKIFIAKPSQGCQGDGIVLITKISQIPKINQTQWIVQPYIDKPLLLQNKKFDLRLYVLISSIQPFICFLNQQGLARFCAQDYQQPNKENIRNCYMHLTNYSLNKNSPNYINGNQVFSRGSKRCLNTVWEDLHKNGCNVMHLKEKIIVVIQKYLVSMYPFIKYYYNATYNKNKAKCFHVLGIDILIDQQMNPWLLQANNNPSFNIQHEAIASNKNIVNPNHNVIKQINNKQKKSQKIQPHQNTNKPSINKPLINSVKQTKQISCVDQYVKSMVIQDTIYLMMRNLQKLKQIPIFQNFFSYKKILSKQSSQLIQMNIIQNMLKIFHSQCSIKNKYILTSSLFTRLSQYSNMTNQKITKNDYHLIFIKIMRDKANPNQMGFEDFIQALEYIIKEVVGYNQCNKLEVIRNHVDQLVQEINILTQ